jgi:hypothetical protein
MITQVVCTLQDLHRLQREVQLAVYSSTDTHVMLVMKKLNCMVHWVYNTLPDLVDQWVWPKGAVSFMGVACGCGLCI